MADNIIGAAWIVVRPDMSGFTAELTASVTSAIGNVQTIADAHPIKFRAEMDKTMAAASASAARGAMVALATPPITFTVAINSAEALAELAAIRAIASLGMGTGGDGGIGGAVAAATAGGAAGKGGGRGILGGLLWGTGGLAGMAAFGSIASLAGLGFERVLTTGIGLAGSFAGALGGLGVLATGVFGKMAVGMGSDMLVMKSTIADTKTFYTALTAIQLAQVTYGKNSAQAAAATAALNVQMKILGDTAGVKAELGLAKMGFALNTFWDKATSSARVAAVGFIEPFISIADTYIPLINAASTKNFGILTTAFKPFIDWANGSAATGIFTNLENLFAASIPIGVDALTQFVELLAKVANWAAPQTGGVMKSIDDFLKNLNSTAGFAHLEGVMTTLVKMFHDWWNLLKQIGITIYDIFDQSVGLGTNIVTTLTKMLTKLDGWLASTSGKASLNNLFTVHLREIDAILAFLPTVLGGIGQIYLILAPALTSIFTMVVDILARISMIPTVGPFLVWLGAIGLFASRMSLFAIGGAAFSGIKNIISLFQALGAGAGFTDALKIAFGSTSAAVQMQTAVTEFSVAVNRFAGFSVAGAGEGAAVGAGAAAGEGAAAGGAAGLLSTLGIGSVTALASGVVAALLGNVGGSWLGNLLGGKIGGAGGANVGGHVGGIAGGAAAGAGAGLLGGPFAELTVPAGAAIGAIAATIAQFWPQILGALKTAFGAVVKWFTQLPGNIANLWSNVYNAVSGFFGGVGKFFTGIWSDVTNWAAGVWKDIANFFIAIGTWLHNLPGRIAAFFEQLPGTIVKWFESINWRKVGADIHNAVVKFFEDLGGWFHDLPGRLGSFFAQHIWTPIVTFFTNLGGWFHDLPGRLASWLSQTWTKIAGFFTDLGGWFHDLPGRLASWFADTWTKIVGVFTSIGGWFHDAPGKLATWFASIPGSLVKIFATVWTDITTVFSKIGAWFASIPAAIAHVLSHLPGIGGIENFFSGLVSGKPTAGGGFFNTPTHLLVGESGPEVVLNRSQFQSMMGGTSSSGRGVTINNTYNVGSNAQRADMEEVVQRNNREFIVTLRGL